MVTARNLIASMAQREQRARRNAHLLVERDESEDPDEETLRREETSLVAAALTRLSPREREILLAHEVSGMDTASLAAERGSTPGAIAAQLGRARARLRVEYLLAQTDTEPPTDRCRPSCWRSRPPTGAGNVSSTAPATYCRATCARR